MLKITKKFYPVILIPDGDSILVKVPDMDIETEGTDINDALEMARDAIELKGVTLEDMGEAVPEPSDKSSFVVAPGETLTEVGADFNAYRRSLDLQKLKEYQFS